MKLNLVAGQFILVVHCMVQLTRFCMTNREGEFSQLLEWFSKWSAMQQCIWLSLVHYQGRRKVAEAAGAAPWKGHERRRRDKFVVGSGDILPQKIFKSTLSEMPFPAFSVEILHNSEYNKTQYKITKGWKSTHF